MEAKTVNNIKKTAFVASIAALYFVLTLISSFIGLDKGIFQIRLSEVLTVLPFFSFYAVPGLFIGCLLSGILTGSLLLDTLFGSIATLLAGIISFLIGRIVKKHKFLCSLPPILINAVYVPFALKYLYLIDGTFLFFFLMILLSETITAGLLGSLILYRIPESLKKQICSI